MKVQGVITAWTLLMVAWIGFGNARPSESIHETFGMNILEKGTQFQQEVDLDEEEHIVTVHVPAHNDVDETYFITDTIKHLTMRVAPQQKMCFLTENDPEELPSAEIWRKTRNIVQNNLIKDAEAKKKMMSYMVTDTLASNEREELASKMRDMCDGLPIVKIKPMFETLQEPEHDSDITPKMTTYINYTQTERTQNQRFKRQIDEYIDACSPLRTRQKCVVFHNSCYFIMDCSTAQDPQGREAASCGKKDHIYDDVRCCMPCCLDEVPEENPSPYCYDKSLTKEKICPHYDFAAEEAAAGDDPNAGGPDSLSKLTGNTGPPDSLSKLTGQNQDHES